MKCLIGSRFIVIGGVLALLTGCSQQSQTVSEYKRDVDRQADLQKQLVERRTDELKEAVLEEQRLAQQKLDADKKQLDMNKKALDDQKKNVDERADFLDKNLEQQETTSKKQIDRNAQVTKERMDQYVRVHK